MHKQLAHTQGKNLLNDKLETAYLVANYYKALQRGTRLPSGKFPTLEQALQSQRILNDYINKVNLTLIKGLRLVNSTLTETQVVWTWQQLLSKAAKFNAGYVKN